MGEGENNISLKSTVQNSFPPCTTGKECHSFEEYVSRYRRQNDSDNELNVYLTLCITSLYLTLYLSFSAVGWQTVSPIAKKKNLTFGLTVTSTG